MEKAADKNPCPRPELSAFLDGELTAAESAALEAHLSECDLCRNDLNLQKGVIRALESDDFIYRDFAIPETFSRTVAVNAESRVSGLRRRSERRTFSLILVALLSTLLLILGGDFNGAFAPAASAADSVLVTISAFGHLLYNIGFGVVVILRTLTHEADAASFFSFAALTILAVFIFYRLNRYMRSTGSGG